MKLKTDRYKSGKPLKDSSTALLYLFKWNIISNCNQTEL